jgi:FixJ family two-component response regulator
MSERLPSVVHVVEDDESVRTALVRLLQAAGHTVIVYASAEEFLSRPRQDVPECAVLDVRMPGQTGLDVQEALVAADDPIPIVFLTGHGDIPMSVQAMRSGAVDFLTKPAKPGALVEAVARALAQGAGVRAEWERQRDLRARYDTLTPREREVFAHVVSGQLNKQIAFDLGAAERTVKAHRHNLMEKLQAQSVADLVRIAHALGLSSSET